MNDGHYAKVANPSVTNQRSPNIRCYTVRDLLAALALSRTTFFDLYHRGQLPFLEELKPRIGKRLRFRADLVDRYLAGEWGQSRTFTSVRRRA